MPELPWALKAAALLWPTPLRAFDPGGEDGRWAELCAQLPWLAALGEPTCALLLRAAQAADGVEAGSPALGAKAGSAALDLLVPNHPLGDRRLKHAVLGGSPVERLEAERAWRSRVASLPTAPPVDAGSYAELWWAWSAPEADPALLDGIPGDTAQRDYPAMRRANLAAALVPTLGQSAGALPELVVLQIGPVQSFITAARRTHDLWTGSMFIAWLTLHAAKAVADALGPDALLSPDLRWHPLARVLVKGEVPTIDDGRTLLTAANSNKLHFLCPHEHVDPVARVALQAAVTEWRRIGEAVRQHLNRIGAERTEGWDQSFTAQIDDLLTLSVVTVPWTADALDEGGGSGADVSEHQAPARFGTLISQSAAASAAARSAAVPPQWPGDARPKCGVDGEREQMGPVDGNADFWQRLREQVPDGTRKDQGPELPMLQIGAGEGLSAVSLTRRFAPEAYFGVKDKGDGEQAPDREGRCAVAVDWNKPVERATLRFPSTRSIAAAPYRKLALARAPSALVAWERSVDGLTGVLGFEAPGNLIPGLGRFDAPGVRQDGDWLFPDRIDEAVLAKEYPIAAEPTESFAPAPGESKSTDLGVSVNRQIRLAERLKELVRTGRLRLGELHDAMGTSPEGQPTPYYAVLMMDVDSLGKALGGTHPLFNQPEGRAPRPLYPSVYAAISERLARMATSVLPQVVHAHLGRVVYCGGDDLLALLPLHTALACADALRRAVQHDDALGGGLTVSVGIGVGHSITPMRAVIDAAREAEKLAKDPLGPQGGGHGDHLGVKVLLRSGRPFGLALPWSPTGTDGAARELEALVDARFESGERAPRLNALPKLEAELVAMLGPPPIKGPSAWTKAASLPVLHRLGVHLGWIGPNGAHEPPLKRLLALRPGGDSVAAAASPAHLIALLRLATFLRRELPTDDLGELLRAVLPAGGRA